MPSIARKHQLQTSLIYHVLNRGNARQDLFHADQDYRYFERLLLRYTKAHHIRLYHWALMTNHYHLCLELPSPEELSKAMAGLQRAYVHYHHRTYDSSGFLFQGRFKSQPIQKERYLLACGRYIEQNPVKGGLVSTAAAYPYSSARCYVTGQWDELITVDPLYDTFGTTPTERAVSYRTFLEQPVEGHELFETEAPMGDETFVKKLVRRHGRFVGRRRGGRRGNERSCNLLK